VTNPRHHPSALPTPDMVPFDLTTFLFGTSTARGVFEDRFGRLRRRFDVKLHGSWQDGVFKLEEQFVYDDGSVEQRVWWVKPVAADRFEARCDDCIGVAAGTCTTDIIRMSYLFRLRLPSRVIAATIDDRFYRVTAQTAINRATVRKWGIRIGEITLVFERERAAADQNTPSHAARLATG
jgi:Protein of unknown function (DUF3833)